MNIHNLIQVVQLQNIVISTDLYKVNIVLQITILNSSFSHIMLITY